MEGAIGAAIEFINVSVRAGSHGAMLDVLVSNQVSHLKHMFSRMSVSVPEATKAISLLDDRAPFSLSQKSELLEAIHTTAANSSDVTVAVNGKTQTNIFFYNYIPEWAWTIFLDKDSSEDDRVHTSVDILHITGNRYPCDDTKKVMVATMLAAFGGRVTHQSAHAMFKLIGTVNTIKRVPRKDEPLTMKRFPQNVKEFLSLHPNCYPPDKLPVVNRISEQIIRDTVPFVASRKNNALLKSSTPSDAIVAAPSCHPNGMMAPNQIQAMMHASIVQGMSQLFGRMCGGDDGDLPNLRTNVKRPRTVAPDALTFSSPNGANDNRSSGRSAHIEPEASDAVTESHDDDEIGLDATSAMADVDGMISTAVAGATAKAKAKAKPTAASPKVCKAKPAMATPPCTPMKVKKGSPHTYDSRPKFGTPCPMTYKGCKVYDAATKSMWRVVPKPGQSPYDKQFKYGGKAKAKVWLDVLKYCERPTIPSTSANYVK